MLDENFTSLLQYIGAPKNVIALSSEQLSFAKAHLPESFVVFLEQYGCLLYTSPSPRD